MKKEFLPYLLPVISLIILFIVLGLNPNITGFAVKDIRDKVSGKVIVFTDSNVVVPLDSVVEVSLDNQTETMLLRDFIEMNGSWYELKNGQFPSIGYYGEGFSGNHIYSLDISSFNLDLVENKDVHILKVRVLYKVNVLSETVQEIKKIT